MWGLDADHGRQRRGNFGRKVLQRLVQRSHDLPVVARLRCLRRVARRAQAARAPHPRPSRTPTARRARPCPPHRCPIAQSCRARERAHRDVPPTEMRPRRHSPTGHPRLSQAMAPRATCGASAQRSNSVRLQLVVRIPNDDLRALQIFRDLERTEHDDGAAGLRNRRGGRFAQRVVARRRRGTAAHQRDEQEMATTSIATWSSPFHSFFPRNSASGCSSR